MTEHTKGVWVQAPAYPTRVIVEGRKGYRGGSYRVADAYCSTVGLVNTPNSREAQANARLIAAAPELLEALVELLPVAEAFERQASDGAGGRRGGHNFRKARAAIAKARGQS